MTRSAKSFYSSDIGVRLTSASAMVAVTFSVLWIGGWTLAIFVTAIGLGLLWEWRSLVIRFNSSHVARALWLIAGIAYIGTAGAAIIALPAPLRWLTIIAVIAVDSGAYFAGRRFGGPKIAPSISPSKTWAGLFGGMIAAAIVMTGAALFPLSIFFAVGSQSSAVDQTVTHYALAPVFSIGAGCVVAILAQAGDFFESWMKRRAGVKDSGSLIPGHGGLFDRADGLLPISIVMGLLAWVRIS